MTQYHPIIEWNQRYILGIPYIFRFFRSDLRRGMGYRTGYGLRATRTTSREYRARKLKLGESMTQYHPKSSKYWTQKITENPGKYWVTVKMNYGLKLAHSSKWPRIKIVITTVRGGSYCFCKNRSWTHKVCVEHTMSAHWWVEHTIDELSTHWSTMSAQEVHIEHTKLTFPLQREMLWLVPANAIGWAKAMPRSKHRIGAYDWSHEPPPLTQPQARVNGSLARVLSERGRVV